MELAKILDVIGVDSNTLVGNVPKENSEIIQEIERSFLLSIPALGQLQCEVYSEKEGTFIDEGSVKYTYLDTIYLTTKNADNEKVGKDVSINFEITDERYSKATLKFKFTAEDPCVRTKFLYHFTDEDTVKKLCAVCEKEGVFSKKIRTYKAKTASGKEFEFAVIQIDSSYMFNAAYIEIEFDNPEDYNNFDFEEYFPYINKDKVKDMNENNIYRMSELYKLFG